MSAKRLRAPKVKDGQLIAYWGRVDGNEPDVCYAWGAGAAKADSRLLHNVMCAERPPFPNVAGEKWRPSFVDEMEARGYDIATLRFSINKKV